VFFMVAAVVVAQVQPVALILEARAVRGVVARVAITQPLRFYPEVRGKQTPEAVVAVAPSQVRPVRMRVAQAVPAS